MSTAESKMHACLPCQGTAPGMASQQARHYPPANYADCQAKIPFIMK
ncbi:MAG: hypothetical protein AVDCRST_MAG56-325 [uncultured Cytophagales bacterium]|uniref:Uncharacterized protein n=1 Tax=uncultured Cytophagales bacterium TaxID=158755 RepID=A0A6J4H1W5_9SPHI|nr:MAG: hypothetical protein AVDCRST_MAG56-325 [uncultured Cytophagales bacterium]